VVAGVVVSGVVSGVLNTLFTGSAMSAGSGPRAVNSAGYNFMRWLGGAASAILVGHVAAWFGNISAPFWAAAACSLVAAGMLLLRKREAPADPHTVPADAAAIGAD
jgi:MFS transporter, ACDE family, multidrug resistance protein